MKMIYIYIIYFLRPCCQVSEHGEQPWGAVVAHGSGGFPFSGQIHDIRGSNRPISPTVRTWHLGLASRISTPAPASVNYHVSYYLPAEHTRKSTVVEYLTALIVLCQSGGSSPLVREKLERVVFHLVGSGMLINVS